MAVISPRALLRRRLDRWWARRHPPADNVLLAQRNVYIVPTRGGWCWAAMVLTLLLGAINYQLNLGYLLCFVLAGVALVSMHSCHATLRGLRFTLEHPASVFAGQATRLVLQLRAERGSRRARHGIGLRLEVPGGTDPAQAAPDEDPAWTWVDVSPTPRRPPARPDRAATPDPTGDRVELALPCPQAGPQALPRLVIETRFPFGLFRAWSYWQAAAQVLVWPAPEEPPPPWPQAPARADGSAPRLPAASRREDPIVADGVRPYRAGDSPRQVAWKKSATALNSGAHAGLVSRSGAQEAEQISLALDWQQAGRAAAGSPSPGSNAASSRPAAARVEDHDARLARLCAWVLQADAAGLDWSLSLPHLHLPAGQGAAHRRACLDALACFSPATGGRP